MTNLTFKKICGGLYINFQYGMNIDHQCIWNKQDGRKWVLSYQVFSIAGQYTRKEEFNTMAEARKYANKLVDEAKSHGVA